MEERFDFTLHRVGATGTESSVAAVATVGGKTYREGYQTIEHRDLETRYLFREARSVLRAVDVTLPGDLAVGYVMGIGDALPAAIGQLGARVQLLQERDLATGEDVTEARRAALYLQIGDVVEVSSPAIGTRLRSRSKARWAANIRPGFGWRCPYLC